MYIKNVSIYMSSLFYFKQVPSNESVEQSAVSTHASGPTSKCLHNYGTMTVIIIC